MIIQHLLGEGKEPLISIFDSKLCQALGKYDKYIQNIHFTDQKTLLPNPYHLRAILINIELIDDYTEFISLILTIVDIITNFKLSASTKQQYEEERAKFEEIKSKDEKQKKIEEAQKKKTEKLLKEKQKLKSLPREQQIKLQDKEKRDEIKKKYAKRTTCTKINHPQSDHYYHLYSTLSYYHIFILLFYFILFINIFLQYQSYTNKPTYLQQLANQKYYYDCYYQEKEYYPQADRSLFQIQKEQHYEYMTKLNNNLEFDFQTLKNKIESLSISYIEQRELFQQMINEISQQQRDIERCKSNIVYINLQKFENNITVIDLLVYLHEQDLKQIKKSDVELFFNSMNQQIQQDYISKLKLQNMIGKDYLTKQDKDENINQIQARIIAMIIETYTHLEFYRQKFQQLALKVDYIFNWLDFDRDGILSFADFKARYPNSEIVFKFLTQQSLDINSFIKLFQPHSIVIQFIFFQSRQFIQVLKFLLYSIDWHSVQFN